MRRAFISVIVAGLSASCGSQNTDDGNATQHDTNDAATNDAALPNTNDAALPSTDGGAPFNNCGAAGAVGDSHAYFAQLVSRTDCLYAASFRDASQVAKLRSQCDWGCSFTYDPANDSDPRQQDAMKMTIPETKVGADEQIRMNFASGGNNGQSMLVTMDYWKGKEFAYDHSLITNHKAAPLMILRSGESATAGFWTGYIETTQSPHTLPGGGPFVEMPWNWVAGSVVKRPGSWRDGDLGFPRLRLPYDVPDNERRGYGEGIAPVDSSIDPGGIEMGIVAERWTRIWLYFERAAEEDFVSENTSNAGTLLRAYKWTTWFADTVRDPIRVIDERIIGLPDGANFAQARVSYGAGNVNIPGQYVGRGDLIAYFRNFVALAGIDKADVLALLQKPVQ